MPRDKTPKYGGQNKIPDLAKKPTRSGYQAARKAKQEPTPEQRKANAEYNERLRKKGSGATVYKKKKG